MLEKVAGFVCIGLLIFLTISGVYIIIDKPEYAEFGKNICLLIAGTVSSVVAGLFQSAKDRFVFEQPASSKCKITIEAQDQ